MLHNNNASVLIHELELTNESSARLKTTALKWREPTVWENIFANDILDKGLISKIYKELTQLQEDKQSN